MESKSRKPASGRSAIPVELDKTLYCPGQRGSTHQAGGPVADKGEAVPCDRLHNIVWHQPTVTRIRRAQLNNHRSVNLWFTGLSGSGKSTLAHAVEERLHLLGCRTFVLDGDNVRHGLCSDLGFTIEDRSENIRRIAEMVNLFLEAGVIALTAFISPLERDRQRVRSIIGQENMLEIHCDCPLEICERRDVKGLYKKARAGLIKNYTGISSPYEPPADPDLRLATGSMHLSRCVEEVLQLLLARKIIRQDDGMSTSRQWARS